MTRLMLTMAVAVVGVVTFGSVCVTEKERVIEEREPVVEKKEVIREKEPVIIEKDRPVERDTVEVKTRVEER